MRARQLEEKRVPASYVRVFVDFDTRGQICRHTRPRARFCDQLLEYHELWKPELAYSFALREKLDVLSSVSEMRLKMCLLCAHIYTSCGTFWKESWGVSGCRSVLELSQSPSSRQLWKPVSWVLLVVPTLQLSESCSDSCQIREWGVAQSRRIRHSKPVLTGS